MKIIGTISTSEAVNLINTGRVVYAYPRKKIVVVNGFKRYSASTATIAAIKQANQAIKSID